MSRAAPLVEVEELAKSFTSHGVTVHAVNGVSFVVDEGETLALVGESGCGKSTIARCLVRLLKPERGRVAFRGREIGSLSQAEVRPLRRDIQMVFQDPSLSLNPSLSVRGTLREPLLLHGMIEQRRELDQRLHELMELVQLDPGLLGRRPDELSGGQKQRVGIARAIATRPSFVVLDEPTSALDMSLRVALLELLAELQERLGMAYLFITHDFSTVRQIADRVIVMYLGKVMEAGRAEDVLDEPLHPYTRALIAAIPVPEPRRKRHRALLAGETPSATGIPRGCPFQDRCPHVMPECRTGEIPFFQVGGREVACLLYRDRPAVVETRVQDRARG
ncbi:MAG: oligopeptide/dipeptide ABC transporter ATP-binding protein [Gaiellaceae bacterium]